MTNSQAWDYAIGLIKVDGLEPTDDFKEYIEKEKKGEITFEDAKRYLDKKYKMKETANGSNFAKKEYLYNIVEDALGLKTRK